MNIDKNTIDPITEYFIQKSYDEGRIITNKKLQKLLYYAQAWCLVLNDKKLFSERIEAWLHGPAVPYVYHQYKLFGFAPIKKDLNTDLIDSISIGKKRFLDNVWKIYGKFDADYLEVLSHKEEPWQLARAGCGEFNPSNKEITPQSMKSFYSKMLKETKKDGKK